MPATGPRRAGAGAAGQRIPERQVHPGLRSSRQTDVRAVWQKRRGATAASSSRPSRSGRRKCPQVVPDGPVGPRLVPATPGGLLRHPRLQERRASRVQRPSGRSTACLTGAHLEASSSLLHRATCSSSVLASSASPWPRARASAFSSCCRASRNFAALEVARGEQVMQRGRRVHLGGETDGPVVERDSLLGPSEIGQCQGQPIVHLRMFGTAAQGLQQRGLGLLGLARRGHRLRRD